MYKPLQFNTDLVCDNCGRYGAYDLGDQHLCSDCYMECGSCCMEFGGHDLWKKDNENKGSAKSSNDTSKKN